MLTSLVMLNETFSVIFKHCDIEIRNVLKRARGNDKSRAKRAIITSLFIIVKTPLLPFPV